MLKSVIWSSMLDYPGKVCTTLFFDRCNFDCEYCQNKDIKKAQEIDFKKEVFPKLLERKPFISHIILSGGECTMDSQFEEIVDLLYKNGFKVGLHTNGYETDMLEKNKDKISYIGMDIKNNLENYDEITQRNIKIQNIKNSIDFIIQNIPEYEFRTTVYPKYVDTENCVKIAKYLGKHNAKKYVIQQYKRIEGIAVIPFSEEKMNEILKQCNQYVKTEGRGWKM